MLLPDMIEKTRAIIFFKVRFSTCKTTLNALKWQFLFIFHSVLGKKSQIWNFSSSFKYILFKNHFSKNSRIWEINRIEFRIFEKSNFFEFEFIHVEPWQRVRKEKRILVFHLAAEFKYITSTLSYSHMEIRWKSGFLFSLTFKIIIWILSKIIITLLKNKFRTTECAIKMLLTLIKLRFC